MILFFLGPDDFTKKERISTLAKEINAEAEFFIGQEKNFDFSELFSSDLFGKTRIVVIKDALGFYDFNEPVAKKISLAKNILIFNETKPDKRLKNTKEWLNFEWAKIETFDLPHGNGFDSWLKNHFQILGAEILPEALNELARRLGRDDFLETKFGGRVVEVKEIFDLWQADSEIKKLIAHSGQKPITLKDVKVLVPENGEVDALKITNAIAEAKKTEALELAGKFLNQGGDEKALIIQLNALLSEQFRNVFMLQDFLNRKISDAEILEITGWKSGRLFILKKAASRFTQGKIKDLLGKLSALDSELKSASTPPRVLLDLILSQLLV